MKSWMTLIVFFIGFIFSIWIIPSIESELDSMGLLVANMLMLFAFWKAMNTQLKPKIKRGRHYKLEKVISHNIGYSIILSYNDNVETYECEEICASLNPQVGKKYLVEIENGTIYFTPI